METLTVEHTYGQALFDAALDLGRVDEIAEEYSETVKVGKINVDEESALAEQHGISSIPTLILYKGGELVAQKSGAAPKNDIVALFKNLI